MTLGSPEQERQERRMERRGCKVAMMSMMGGSGVFAGLVAMAMPLAWWLWRALL